MKIKSFQGGFDKNLSYLIWCDSTHIACIVDASVKMTEINRFIEKHALNLLDEHNKIITNSIIYYSIFSLPGIGLVYIWGGVYDTNNFGME